MNTPSSKASLTTCIIYIIYYLLTAYHIIQRKQNNCLHFHLIREITTAMLWHFQFLSFNLPRGPANPPHIPPPQPHGAPAAPIPVTRVSDMMGGAVNLIL